MKKTSSEINVLKVAIEKGYNIDTLSHRASSSGVFTKHETGDNYSASWIKLRLKLNDVKVENKLLEYCSDI